MTAKVRICKRMPPANEKGVKTPLTEHHLAQQWMCLILLGFYVNNRMTDKHDFAASSW